MPGAAGCGGGGGGALAQWGARTLGGAAAHLRLVEVADAQPRQRVARGHVEVGGQAGGHMVDAHHQGHHTLPAQGQGQGQG